MILDRTDQRKALFIRTGAMSLQRQSQPLAKSIYIIEKDNKRRKGKLIAIQIGWLTY